MDIESQGSALPHLDSWAHRDREGLLGCLYLSGQRPPQERQGSCSEFVGNEEGPLGGPHSCVLCVPSAGDRKDPPTQQIQDLANSCHTLPLLHHWPTLTNPSQLSLTSWTWEGMWGGRLGAGGRAVSVESQRWLGQLGARKRNPATP